MTWSYIPNIDRGPYDVIRYIYILSGWWFGTMEFYDFPFHHPNWRSHIFQRGRLNHQPVLNILYDMIFPIFLGVHSIFRPIWFLGIRNDDHQHVEQNLVNNVRECKASHGDIATGEKWCLSNCQQQLGPNQLDSLDIPRPSVFPLVFYTTCCCVFPFAMGTFEGQSRRQNA